MVIGFLKLISSVMMMMDSSYKGLLHYEAVYQDNRIMW